MARHQQLDELAGKDRDYDPNEMTLKQKRIDQDLDRVIGDSIRKTQSPVDESHIREENPPQINLRNGPRRPVVDPEDLGGWPYRKGREDYPDDNEA